MKIPVAAFAETVNDKSHIYTSFRCYCSTRSGKKKTRLTGKTSDGWVK